MGRLEQRRNSGALVEFLVHYERWSSMLIPSVCYNASMRCLALVKHGGHSHVCTFGFSSSDVASSPCFLTTRWGGSARTSRWSPRPPRFYRGAAADHHPFTETKAWDPFTLQNG